MRLVGRWVGAVVVACLSVAVGCGGKDGQPAGGTGAGNGSVGGSGSGGSPDGGGSGGGGSGGGTDAGTGGIDGGSGRTDGGSDAGTGGIDGGAGGQDGGIGGTDGGTGGTAVVPPSIPNWQFYTATDGLTSSNVMGASADEGGNVWVAGGKAGLFVQRAGSRTFQQFGLKEGLHPYGYMADGSPADRNPSLNAISVSGGPAGTAFVGYRGRLDASDGVPPGTRGCEDNWDITWNHAGADPSIYKSGDADRVSLTGSGISVVHYDIFSGPNVIGNEATGREKLCTIYRVLYQHGTNFVWFGGNHGFAFGKADFASNPTCDGQLSCAGAWEHVHPHFNDSAGNLVTGDYWGIAIDPSSQNGFHDVWFGGMARTTRFRFGQTGGDYFAAQPMTEDWSSSNIRNNPKVMAAWLNRIDVWPDAVKEYDLNFDPIYPTPAQWKAGLDLVSGIAANPADNSVYIASFGNGLVHLDHDGHLLEDLTSLLFAKNVSAVALDTDGSLWIGYKYVGGVSRLKSGKMQHFAGVLGDLVNSPVYDIQIQPAVGGSHRKVLVAFQVGALGSYDGD